MNIVSHLTPTRWAGFVYGRTSSVNGHCRSWWSQGWWIERESA